MKKVYFIVAVIILALIGFIIINVNDKNMDSERLIEMLKAKGYTVDKPEENNPITSDSLLTVDDTYYEVNDKRIDIYEYSTTRSAKKDSRMISRDGYYIGSAVADWVDTPHFYRRGKIIVSYVGNDAKFLKDLEDILGKSITK